jgi:predicted nucleic-acid-binding protein
MIALDTNYILRYLLDDNHEMHLVAKKVIHSNACLVLNEVISEVIYVLRGVYDTPKARIVKSLSNFIKMENLSMHEDKDVLLDSLKIYESKNLDFVDCYLCALSDKYEVKSFDKKLMKCMDAK